MGNSIRFSVWPSLGGPRSTCLKRIDAFRGGDQYWLSCQGFGSDDTIDQEFYRLPFRRGEAVWQLARHLPLTLTPDAAMGCDGTTCVLEFTGDSNSLRLRWWQRLPPQWSSVLPLLHGLEALRRRARFHLVPVERSFEALSTLAGQGEGALWDRLATTVCAFHESKGRWPTRLRLPEGGEKAIRARLGEQTLQALHRRLELVPDPQLTWGAFERIAAEDRFLNRIDYPRDAGGVDWRENAAFREWIGLDVAGEAEQESR